MVLARSDGGLAGRYNARRIKDLPGARQSAKCHFRASTRAFHTKAIGMPTDQVEAVSGHSIRVGAAQDLLSLNIDLASVMQAGRWKSARMPMRYGEHVLAARVSMARAASAQGRDED